MPVSATSSSTWSPSRQTETNTFPAGQVVLDGVFHQIEADLVQVVLRTPQGTAGAQAGLHRDLGGVRHRGQHGQGAPGHGGKIHDLGGPHRKAVQPGEGEQMLGDAGETVGLLPNVRDEVPQGFLVHLLALEDGVGQQADGGQRGLEFMGGVGDKTAAEPPLWSEGGR